MAVMRWLPLVLGVVIVASGCSKSEEPAASADTPGTAATGPKGPEAGTPVDPSKGDRDAGDMPGGGPTNK